MSDNWEFVLNEKSVHFLISLRVNERRQLLAILETLIKDPLQKGFLESRDATGRPIQIKRAGRFLISYWPIHLSRNYE